MSINGSTFDKHTAMNGGGVITTDSIPVFSSSGNTWSSNTAGSE